MAQSIAVALVSARLDYANSVLCGTSQSNILKLQTYKGFITIYLSWSRKTIEFPHLQQSSLSTGFLLNIAYISKFLLLHTNFFILIRRPTWLQHCIKATRSETFDLATLTCSINHLHPVLLTLVPFTWPLQPFETISH